MANVLLVDEQDKQIWLCEKLKAHEDGVLHRAFSVYLINSKREILLQQRALHKYHSPWIRANTCCSHQFAWEENDHAAHRRLREEMWCKADLYKMTEFVYKEPVPPGLIEHEYLHLYFWVYEWQEYTPNPEEVADTQWVSFDELQRSVDQRESSLATRTQATRRLCSHLFEQFYKEKYS